MPPGSHVNVFADASVQFGNQARSQANDVGLFQYEVSAGPSFFFTTSSALELIIGYRAGTYRSTPEAKFNSTFVGLGFQVHLTKE